MKNIMTIAVLIFACSANANSNLVTLRAHIVSALEPFGAKTSFSLRTVNDGKEIIGVRSETKLSPASIAKAVSTGCSLLTLGPAFQFETEFGYTGKIQGDKLKGNLVVRGQGDPSLVIEDLKEILEKLRVVYGIKTIEGQLVFDTSYMGKDSLVMSEGFAGDNGRSFAAELTPNPFNQNSFSIWTADSNRGDGKTVVSSLPAGAVKLSLKNQTKMGASTGVSVQYDPVKLVATVSGTLGSSDEPKGYWRAVPDNYAYYSAMIHQTWLQSGGEWASTEFKTSSTPVSYTRLWVNRSRPLAKILMDINKLSLNMGAELTLLAAGVAKQGKPANYDKALNVINKCLKDFSISTEGVLMTNASGLSRETRLETRALSEFLVAMDKTNYAPEYLASFSILGVDGTGKARLKEFSGRGRIKTGSIAGVSSIAGYLSGKDGQNYSFALILNGVEASNPKVKKAQDLILEKILQL